MCFARAANFSLATIELQSPCPGHVDTVSWTQICAGETFATMTSTAARFLRLGLFGRSVGVESLLALLVLHISSYTMLRLDVRCLLCPSAHLSSLSSTACLGMTSSSGQLEQCHGRYGGSGQGLHVLHSP